MSRYCRKARIPTRCGSEPPSWRRRFSNGAGTSQPGSTCCCGATDGAFDLAQRGAGQVVDEDELTGRAVGRQLLLDVVAQGFQRGRIAERHDERNDPLAPLVIWFAGDGDNPYMAALALACLILGSVVSYAKARAEGLP